MLTQIPETLVPGNVKLYVFRDDLNHPLISGNKLRKMKYNIKKAKSLGNTRMLTFGGAFSNHIFAAAAAGREYNIDTIGVIRGERPATLNPTLRFAEKQGMKLEFVSRADYRNKNSEEFLQELGRLFGDFYLVPEGGSNRFAIPGVAELISEIDVDFDYIVTACGTAGTLAGLSTGIGKKKTAIGVPVLKGGEFIEAEAKRLLAEAEFPDFDNRLLWTDYHFGGYAKHKPELISFINQFRKETDIPLDPVYTGKMMFALTDKIRQGFFPENSTVIAIHTGGLQGIDGFNERFGKLIET
ncbi:1-aminocyclopropane-1-carboxylate deaminase [Fulvitalea axinellae]|uniref:1-aminocyclopropane-1-carboxylate deaminase n=1 Tax=Fulvitalea axinellae TaxID=1182444 RepID=A0AAU9CND2_9BACT|nr:1-aminocyclopropane-1-carboxylate deaminase [Fulvitalea axinellae]